MSVLTWIGVALLGGAGAVARYRVGGLVSLRARTTAPVGTLAVNLSGAFCLGLLTGASVGGTALLLAGTAFLGAYTTFSTWLLETRRLAADGLRPAAAYLVASVVGGLAAAAAGWALGAVL